MAVKLEIIGKSERSVSVAFYYPVVLGDREVRADVQSRTPAGSALSPGEIQGLRDGAIFELLRGFSTHGFTRAKMKVRLNAAWTEQEVEALATYRSAYKDLGAAMDDTGTWS